MKGKERRETNEGSHCERQGTLDVKALRLEVDKDNDTKDDGEEDKHKHHTDDHLLEVGLL